MQGKFKAVAIRDSAQFGETANGDEQIAVEFVLADQSMATVTWFGNFVSEKSTDVAKAALANAGWDGEDLSDLDGLGSIECELVIVEEAGTDGALRDKVQWVRPIGGGGFRFKKPLDQSRVKALAERVKSGGPPPPRQATVATGERRYGTAGNYGAPQRGAKEPDYPAYGNDDDIPF